MVLSTVLSLAIAWGPSVAVEVAVDEGARDARAQEVRALRGWLVQRLIEEGFTIAPTDRADRIVTLHLGHGAEGDAVTVESSHDGFTIDGGPAAVMRLEALQRTRMLLEHAEPVAPPPTPVVQHAVLGFRSATEAPEGAAGDLESALLVEGYVLTPRPRASDPVLCVVHAERWLEASVTTGEGSCPDPQVRVRYRELHQPEGVEPIVALVEAAREGDAIEPPPNVVVVRDDVTPEPAPEPPQRRWPSKDAEVRLGFDAGLAMRGEPDAYLRAGMRLGRVRGPGAALSFSVIPSRGERVRVVDTVLAVGPDMRFGKRKVGFGVGLVGGALVHAFATDTSRGGTARWYVGVPTKLSIGKAEGVRGHLFTEGFMTGGGLEHLNVGAPGWRRTAWGIRLGIGITYGWNIS